MSLDEFLLNQLKLIGENMKLFLGIGKLFQKDSILFPERLLLLEGLEQLLAGVLSLVGDHFELGSFLGHSMLKSGVFCPNFIQLRV